MKFFLSTNLIIFLGLIHFSASAQNDSNACIQELFSSSDPAYSQIYNKSEMRNHFDEIQHNIDSANYQVIRWWSSNSKRQSERISNQLTGVDYYKEYDENGVLKASGFMTSMTQTKVGIWSYFTNGVQDSTTNFDEQYTVSFCAFYQMMTERKLTGPTSTISFDLDQRKWKIEKWTFTETSSKATILELQVDSMEIEEKELN